MEFTSRKSASCTPKTKYTQSIKGGCKSAVRSPGAADYSTLGPNQHYTLRVKESELLNCKQKLTPPQFKSPLFAASISKPTFTKSSHKVSPTSTTLSVLRPVPATTSIKTPPKALEKGIIRLGASVTVKKDTPIKLSKTPVKLDNTPVKPSTSKHSFNDEDEDLPLVRPFTRPLKTYSNRNPFKGKNLTFKPENKRLFSNAFNSENSASSTFATNSVTRKLLENTSLTIKPIQRKPLSDLHSAARSSSLLSGISPIKVEKAYGIPEPSNNSEKENVPLSPVEEQPVKPFLVGFPNLGNTCYINSVAQCLASLEFFKHDICNIVRKIDFSETSVIFALSALFNARATGLPLPVRGALQKFKNSVGLTDPIFLDYKMQDANEFLTKVLDVIKEEVKSKSGVMEQLHEASGSPQASSSVSLPSSASKKNPLHLKRNDSCKRVFKFGCSSSTSDDDDDDDVFLVDSSTSYVHNRKRLVAKNTEDLEECEPTTVDPITNNFGFKLREIYRCLQCDNEIIKLQESFCLYVHVLAFDDEEESQEFGPDSIKDAVKNYLKTDYRDYRCEKCDHNKVEVTSTFATMPRVLIIQMKRYAFSNEFHSSLKVKTSVYLNKLLNLSPYTSNETAPYSYVRLDYSRYTSAQSSSAHESPLKKFCPEGVLRGLQNTSDGGSHNSLDAATSPAAADCTSTQPATDLTGELSEEEQLKEAMKRSLEDDPRTTEELDRLDQETLDSVLKESLNESQLKESLNDSQVENIEEDLFVTVPDSMSASKKYLQLKREDEEDAASNYSSPHCYVLSSIVCHRGENTSAGHYFSDVLSDDGKAWLNYDDDSVTFISEAEALGLSRQCNGYTFFYVHRELLTSNKTV